MSEIPSEKKTPLVSVVIPFYNREAFLRQAVESVINQTETDWEILLVDDASTDGSALIAQEYAKDFPGKIFLISHGKNRGAGAARKSGVDRARGEYLTFLDSDDVFFLPTLERSLAAFDKNPKADVVCGTLECWYSWTDQSDRREKDFVVDLVLQPEKLYQPPDLLVFNLNAGGRKPGIGCVTLKTDFAREIAVFAEDFRYMGEDQVFWAKVCLNGKIFVMDAVLAKYRQHPDSTCAAEIESGQELDSTEIFLDWLTSYLEQQNIQNREVWKALQNYRKATLVKIRLKKIRRLYCSIFPLHMRYKFRDILTKTKRFLLRSAHRHK